MRNGLSKMECEVDGLFLIIAGSDTTASVIRITMLYLMTCPQAYRKLKDEIAAAIRDGKASFPISQDEAKRLPYLQVCFIKAFMVTNC
jgi:cytochrome P450